MLPVRSILGGPIGPRHHVNVNMNYPPAPQAGAPATPLPHHSQQHSGLPPPPGTMGKKGSARARDYYDEDYEEDGGEDGGSSGAKKIRRGDGIDGGGYGYGSGSSGGKAPISGQLGELSIR